MNIKKIGVVGAGMMGAEIALCFAKAGFEVKLASSGLPSAERGKARLTGVLDKSVEKGKFEAAKRDEVVNRVHPCADHSELADCDYIVEAAPEVLEKKQEIFAGLDKYCKKDCIISSNTSSISITKLAALVSEERQDKFIGVHFNSPASVMKLVEVIPGILTDESVVETTLELLGTIEKEPVLVKDVVGFALNRLFHAFYLEACRLVEEGVCSAEDVDKVCVHGLGHPVGIFKLLDLLGHDLNLNVDQILFEAYGDRFRPSPQIQRLVDAGRLGRKTGKGFFDYTKK